VHDASAALPEEKGRLGERAWRAASTLATLLPPLFVAYLIARRGVDLPFYDQWDLVPRLQELASGHWSWTALWLQHNEHRILVPQALMLLLARATAWSVCWELAVNLAVAGALFAALLAWLRVASPKPLPLWVPPLLSLLVFNPNQWENWTWGWQLAIFLVALAAVGCVAWLSFSGERPWLLAPAVACAAIGTFCFANGLLLWPLGLGLVAAQRKTRWRRMAIWVLAALCCLELFFFRYGWLPRLEQSSHWRQLKLLSGDVAIYLRAPFFGFHGELSLYAGIVAVGAALFYVGRRLVATLGTPATERTAQLERELPWIVLLAFGAAGAVLTGLGRMDLGLHQALSSRYVTLSNLFWIGLLGLWLVGPRERPRWSPALLGAAVACLVAAGASGESMFVLQEKWRREMRVVLCRPDGPDAGADLSLLYPEPRLIRERIEILRHLRLGPFRDPRCGAEAPSPAAASGPPEHS